MSTEERVSREWAWAAHILGLRARMRMKDLHGFVSGVPLLMDRAEGTLIRATAALPDGFALTHETLGSRVGGLLGAGDLVTGDGAFDAEIRVSVNARHVAHARAILWSAPRSEIRRLLDDGVTIAHDAVELRRGEVLDDSAKIVALAKEIAELASMLSVPRRDVPDRLFDNTFDPEPDVRLQCLRALLEHHPRTEACERAVTVSLGDSDPRVQLEAALDERSGARGTKVLERLASGTTALRARAAKALAKRAPDRIAHAGRVSLSEEGAAGALSEPPEKGAVSVAAPPKKKR